MSYHTRSVTAFLASHAGCANTGVDTDGQELSRVDTTINMSGTDPTASGSGGSAPAATGGQATDPPSGRLGTSADTALLGNGAPSLSSAGDGGALTQVLRLLQEQAAELAALRAQQATQLSQQATLVEETVRLALERAESTAEARRATERAEQRRQAEATTEAARACQAAAQRDAEARQAADEEAAAEEARRHEALRDQRGHFDEERSGTGPLRNVEPSQPRVGPSGQRRGDGEMAQDDELQPNVGRVGTRSTADASYTLGGNLRAPNQGTLSWRGGYGAAPRGGASGGLFSTGRPPMTAAATPLGGTAGRPRLGGTRSDFGWGQVDREVASIPWGEGDDVQRPHRMPYGVHGESTRVPSLPKVELREKFTSAGTGATLEEAYELFRAHCNTYRYASGYPLRHEMVMDFIHLFFHDLTKKKVQVLVQHYRALVDRCHRTDIWFALTDMGTPDLDSIIFDVDPAEQLWQQLRLEYPVEHVKAIAEWNGAFTVAEGEDPAFSLDRLLAFAGKVPDYTQTKACRLWRSAVPLLAIDLPEPPGGEWTLVTLCAAFKRLLRKRAEGEKGISSELAEMRKKMAEMEKAIAVKGGQRLPGHAVKAGTSAQLIWVLPN
eukprot:jgi/Mesvir1/28312/Mv04832-RA.1